MDLAGCLALAKNVRWAALVTFVSVVISRRRKFELYEDAAELIRQAAQEWVGQHAAVPPDSVIAEMIQRAVAAARWDLPLPPGVLSWDLLRGQGMDRWRLDEYQSVVGDCGPHLLVIGRDAARQAMADSAGEPAPRLRGDAGVELGQAVDDNTDGGTVVDGRS